MTHAIHLTAHQLDVLRAVAGDRITHNCAYGDLAPYELDGHPVGATLTLLAARGLIAFDPLLPSPAHVTNRGRTILHSDPPPTTEGSHG